MNMNAKKIVTQAGGTPEARGNGGNKPLDGKINRGKFDPNEYRKNYKVMHVGIGTKHAKEHGALEALAEKWNLPIAALVWDAIGKYIASSPVKPDIGSAAVSGSAAGYWTVPITGADGKATDIEVVHVEQRADLPEGKKGHTFFRYDRDDVKSQERAKRQAERAATYFKKILLGDQAQQPAQK